MLFMMLALQMPTDPPMSFTALQWATLGALSAALIYVFRQWQAERQNCQKRYLETIDKLLVAIEDEAKTASVNKT